MDYHELATLCLMYLDENYTTNFHAPGAVHHARYMSKSTYYVKYQLLIKDLKKLLNLSREQVREIHRLAIFIAVIWAPAFLTAERADNAAVQVLTFL